MMRQKFDKNGYVTAFPTIPYFNSIASIATLVFDYLGSSEQDYISIAHR